MTDVNADMGVHPYDDKIPGLHKTGRQASKNAQDAVTHPKTPGFDELGLFGRRTSIGGIAGTSFLDAYLRFNIFGFRLGAHLQDFGRVGGKNEDHPIPGGDGVEQTLGKTGLDAGFRVTDSIGLGFALGTIFDTLNPVTKFYLTGAAYFDIDKMLSRTSGIHPLNYVNVSATGAKTEKNLEGKSASLENLEVELGYLGGQSGVSSFQLYGVYNYTDSVGHSVGAGGTYGLHLGDWQATGSGAANFLFGGPSVRFFPAFKVAVLPPRIKPVMPSEISYQFTIEPVHGSVEHVIAATYRFGETEKK